MMIKWGRAEIGQLPATGGTTASKAMNRWQCGFWDLSHCSVIGTVTQQHGRVYALTHAHTHTSKHTSKHTHGPHILCMVTACSLLFGCQYCNTALWLNSWPVSVCLQSVCQPCYDVICSSERQTEKLMTLVKSGKIFPAASPLSLSFCLNHHFLPSPTHTISFTYLQPTP